MKSEMRRLAGKPKIYRLQESCYARDGKEYEYWETTVCTAENPDADFKNADQFVEKADYDKLAQALIRTLDALEKCKKQRNECMGDFTLDYYKKIEAARAEYDKEIEAILEGSDEKV